MTKKMGVIESPNFPSNYSSNVNCEWNIVAPSNRKILILIPEMNIYYNDNRGCEDVLSIVKNGKQILLFFFFSNRYTNHKDYL